MTLRNRSLKPRKASLTEKLTPAYQHFYEIEESKGGDPEPRLRKVLSGLGFSNINARQTNMRALGVGGECTCPYCLRYFPNPDLLLLDKADKKSLDLEGCDLDRAVSHDQVLWYADGGFTG